MMTMTMGMGGSSPPPPPLPAAGRRLRLAIASTTTRTITTLLLPQLLLLVSFFTGFASADFNPAKDHKCASTQGICLTSFIWCPRDGDSGSGCSYPANSDPFMPGTNSPYAVIYHNRQYEITWRQAVAGVPVLIEWLFSQELYYDVDSLGDVVVMWSTNTTNASFIFDPRAILMSFPTEAAPNVDKWQAVAASHDASNHLRISQPTAPAPALQDPVVTDQFLVQTDWTYRFMTSTREYDRDLYHQQSRNWQLGVGVGIGIGMPLLVVVACCVGHRMGTRAGYDLAEKVARRRGV